MKEKAHNVKRIIIDSRSRINYASYYIQGVAQLYGWGTIAFGIIPISPLTDQSEIYSGCALSIQHSDARECHVFIDTHDSDIVREDLYQWADVYAKINVNPKEECMEKLLVIGPSFGIQLWNPFKTLLMGVLNYYRCRIKAKCRYSFRTFILDYAYTFVRRNQIGYYDALQIHEDREYVFAMSTLWYDAQTYSTTNHYRGVFAKACKRLYPSFEGGFFYIPLADVERQFPQYREYLDEYRDMLTTRRIGMKEYLDKTKKSAIVFNTPSVLGCHGWKMGEYLAMGKAIISTQLNNLMPGDFIDGVHYLGVKDDMDIAKAVGILKNNEALRCRLKENARNYYETYLSPSAVVRRIMERCN